MRALLDWQNLIFVLAMLLGVVLVIGSALGSDHDIDGDGHPDIAGDHPGLLTAFGIRRVPISVFVTTALFAFGAIGSALNLLLAPLLKVPLVYGSASIAIATLGALVVARGVARAVARFVPHVESYAIEKHEVIGSLGVAETRISRQFGIVRVSDRTGSLMQLKCRALAEPILRGREVVVIDYDADSDFYTVDENT
jgi:hypothetical protein